jgi:hypothetical protein
MKCILPIATIRFGFHEIPPGILGFECRGILFFLLNQMIH